MPRGSLILLVPALLVIAAVLFTLKGFEPVPGTATEPALPEPRYELGRAEWVRLDQQGQPQMRATAESIEYFDDRSAQLNQLVLDRLGGRDGPWHITAPRGVVPPNQTRMKLSEPVTITGRLREGDTVKIETDRLWVDWQQRELYTEDAVVLHGSSRQARANGLRADWSGRRVELLRDVQVDYDAPG